MNATTFSAEWLARREPVDHASRSAALARDVGRRLAGAPIRALDLATGAGSNLRYLMTQLASDQHWLLVDDDALLLAVLRQRTTAWSRAGGIDLLQRTDGALECHVPWHVVLRLNQVSLAPRAPMYLFDHQSLVTASALLDLVSEDWLDDVIGHARRARADVLFALTYDGRMDLSPDDPTDALVRELVNRHQRGDKGFGRALGPDAPEAAQRILEREGYQVRLERSDWQLRPAEHELQRELIDGWTSAATEIAPEQAGAIREWEARRLHDIAARRLTIVVGHQDVGGWL